MAGTKLTQEVLSETSARSIETAGDIHSLVTAVRSQLSPILDGKWKGSGATAAGTAWMELEGQLNKIKTSLQNIGTALGTANTNYGETDQNQGRDIQNVAAEVTGISSSLGMSV